MAKMRIAIIGLGASGAYAARAAYDMGHDVEIYAVQTGTMSPGATWLHWVPEDITKRFTPSQIYVVGKGTPKEYTTRQWGKPVESSFPSSPVWEIGYDPSQILDAMVPSACNVNNVPYNLSDADVRDISPAFDMVFQTFSTRDSREQQPPLVPFIAAAKFGTQDPKTNYVVYNGTTEGIVVREAQLFGNQFLEFPKGMDLSAVKEMHNIAGWETVMLRDIDPRTKPWQLSDPKIHLVGRWAMWDRKFLSHDAYNHVQKIIRAKVAQDG